MITTILAFIIVLGVLVMVHELGHFLAAKKLGVKVLEFAIGFPPRVFSFKKKETKYSIGAIPLGGYVSMLGENEKSDDKRAFINQTPGKRLIIAAAGVVMNFLLAWFLLFIGFSIGMSPVVSAPSEIPGKVISNQIYIVDIEKDTPAEKAGLKAGDILLSFQKDSDEFVPLDSNDVVEYTKANANQEIVVNYKRDNQIGMQNVKLNEADKTPLGVALTDYSIIRVPFYKSFYVSLRETAKITSLTFSFIKNLFSTLFTQGEVIEGVGGPVAIFTFSGMAFRAGWMVFLQFIAMLSVNLGLINLLPIPALDGGRVLFILIEKLFGRKVVKEEVENIIHAIGFILLILLIIAISYRDVVRLISG